MRPPTAEEEDSGGRRGFVPGPRSSSDGGHLVAIQPLYSMPGGPLMGLNFRRVVPCPGPSGATSRSPNFLQRRLQPPGQAAPNS